MITPFQIYLVMQLDSFLSIFTAFLIFSFLYAGVVCLFHLNDFSEEKKQKWPSRKKAIKLAVSIFFVSSVLLSLTPSTKTAAAMIVIPAIVNNENLQNEASELYLLAKDALKSAISADEKK